MTYHQLSGLGGSVEVFFMEEDLEWEVGWYWWPCYPGCLPDGDAVGPFDTEAQAKADALGLDVVGEA